MCLLKNVYRTTVINKKNILFFVLFEKKYIFVLICSFQNEIEC